MFKKFLVVCALFPVFAAQAGTDFQCELVVDSASGKNIRTSGTWCSATVVHFNMQTDELQEVVRSCRLRRSATTCSASFDDAEVAVGYPVIAAVSGYSRASHIHRYARIGCVQDVSDLITDSDDFGNHTVQITQRLNCP